MLLLDPARVLRIHHSNQSYIFDALSSSRAPWRRLQAEQEKRGWDECAVIDQPHCAEVVVLRSRFEECSPAVATSGSFAGKTGTLVFSRVACDMLR